MSEHPREPLGQRPPINVVRRFLKIVVITICVLLLIGAVFVASRYTTNRRLMALAKPSDPQGVDVSFGWDGPTTGPAYDWLERRIGMEPAFALLCRPVSLIVSGRDENVSDATVLRLLRESSGMKQVFIHNRDLPVGCLEAIATRHQVEVLDIRLPVVGGQEAEWLLRMTRLKQVNVSQFVREPRENDWSWLKSLPKLEALGVTMWDATERDVIALAECAATESLHLTGEDLSDDALNRLCDLPALKYLSLQGSRIRLRFPNERKLPSTLETLDINWTGVDDESLAAIAGLAQLNRVSIMGGTVSDAGMETLARLPALRQLWLQELKQVTEDGLKDLISNPSLCEVVVKGCGISPQGLILLMEIPNWTDITYEDIHFHRQSGTTGDAVSLEQLEAHLKMRRQMQEERNSVEDDPIR